MIGLAGSVQCHFMETAPIGSRACFAFGPYPTPRKLRRVGRRVRRKDTLKDRRVRYLSFIHATRLYPSGMHPDIANCAVCGAPGSLAAPLDSRPCKKRKGGAAFPNFSTNRNW